MASIWRPISPESEIDVESDGDEVIDATMTQDVKMTAANDTKMTEDAEINYLPQVNNFKYSENSAFSKITPKKNFEKEKSDDPLDFSQSRQGNEGKDLEEKTEAYSPTREKSPECYKPLENQERQLHENLNYAFSPYSRHFGYGVGLGHYDPRLLARPMLFPDPRVPMAYYMTMARLQMEEHHRLLTRSVKNDNLECKEREMQSSQPLPIEGGSHSAVVHPALISYPTRHRDPNKPAALKKYKCDVCDKAFSRSNTLVTHKRIHTGEKPFACELCGRAFRQPGNLTRHRLTHTTVKPYVCIRCNKAFNRASNLHTHMRTHGNLQPHNCHICKKSFHNKVDLKIHLYTHTGEPNLQ